MSGLNRERTSSSPSWQAFPLILTDVLCSGSFPLRVAGVTYRSLRAWPCSGGKVSSLHVGRRGGWSVHRLGKMNATTSLSARAMAPGAKCGQVCGIASVSMSCMRSPLCAWLWVDILCKPTWPGGAFCHALMSLES